MSTPHPPKGPPGSPASGPKARPFAGLAKLRGRLGKGPGRDIPGTDEGTAPSQLPTEDGLALLKASLGPIQPLPDNNRVALEPPKPPPRPRPKIVEPQENPSQGGRLAPPPVDPFAAAMADVTPIKDSGRVDFSPSRGAPPPQERPSLPQIQDPAALFRHATQGTTPLPTKDRIELPPPTPAPLPTKRAADDQAVLHEALATPLTFEDRLDSGDEAAFLRPGLPRRVLTDLRRGRWVVQRELDLHGLNRDEARATLAGFLAISLQQGLRCLRIIHGKGLGSPGGVGLLKQLSQGWLAQREEILAFCQARPHDGGSGALLVLLRAGGNRGLQGDAGPRPHAP